MATTQTQQWRRAQSSSKKDFMALPTELLDQVTGFLPRSSLCALALTCERTYKSAVIVLYTTYLNRQPPAKAPFHLFLRTLCERPDLAARVKHVDIRGWRSEYEVLRGTTWRGITKKRDVDDVERDGPSFSSTEKVINGSAKDRHKLFVEAAVNVGLIAKPASLSFPPLKNSIIWYISLKEDDDFLRMFGRGLEDAQFVLILALLPNLESLTIDELSPYPLLDWHHFLSRSTTALRNLLKLRINGSITTQAEPVVMNDLQILDIIPKLYSLQLFDIVAKGHKFTLNTLPSDNVKCFVFSNCGMSLRLNTITLRYLRYKAHTKTVLEQLAQLKIQDFFPSLTRVRLLFWASTLTSYTVTSPVGNVATTTAWHALPDVTQKVHHDLDKLYTNAGIDVEIHQCEG